MENSAVKETHQIPDEMVSDTSNSQVNDRSETPDSNRGQQDNDSITLSPKISKPVLGKAQAKKRLMAFAKFNATVKSNEKERKRNHTDKDSELQKSKLDDAKRFKDSKEVFKPEDLADSRLGIDDGDLEKSQNSQKKIKKRSEKKLAAIEEIMREESKQKQLISIDSLEQAVTYDKFQFRHQSEQRNRDCNKRFKDHRNFRNWNDNRRFNPRFNDRKFAFNSQNDNKHSQFSGQSTQSKKSSIVDKKKNSSEKRDNDGSKIKIDMRMSKSDDNEPSSKTKEEKKIDKDITYNKNDEKKKKNSRFEKNSLPELGNHWGQFKTHESLIRARISNKDSARASPVELKSRSVQEYKNIWEQMLMVNNIRPYRSCVVVNGIDDSRREYPPESIRVTRRFNKGPMFYAENPNVSMIWNRRRLFQVLPPDRCRLMKEISDSPSQNLDTYEAPKMRNWYKQIDNNGRWEIVKRITQFGGNIADTPTNECGSNVSSVPPKSRWEMESDELLISVNDTREIEGELVTICKTDDENPALEEGEISREDIIDDNEKEKVKEQCEKVTEELVSEYEQFMKIVSTDPENSEAIQDRFSPNRSASIHSSELTETKVTSLEQHYRSGEEKNENESEIRDSSLSLKYSTKSTSQSEKILNDSEKLSENEEEILEELVEYQGNPKIYTIEKNKSKFSKVHHKKNQKNRVSSTDSSNSSSSSGSELEKRKRQSKKRKKKKRVRDSSTESSSSEDSSNVERMSKKRRKKSKRRKKETKMKLKKKTARRDSPDSESSDSTERTGRSRKKKRMQKILFKHSRISIRDRSTSSEKSQLCKVKIEAKEENIPLEKNLIPVQNHNEFLKEEKVVVKIEKAKTHSTIIGQEDDEIQETVKKPVESLEMQLEKNKDSIWKRESHPISDPDKLATIPIPEEAHPCEILKPEEIPLPLLPNECKKKSPSPEKKLDKEQIMNKKEKKRLKSKEQRILEGNRTSISTSSSSTSDSTSSCSSSSSSSSSSDGSGKHQAKHYSTQNPYDRKKILSRVLKKNKYKWVTEFDFDFPSLTELNQGVASTRRVQSVVDDWEVDSLEDIRDFASSYVKEKSKKSKKVGKEVRYDEKTDTYIAVEKECRRENKKKQPGRVCALRIWEDEEEEGEREALLMEKTIQPIKEIEPWQSEPSSVPLIEVTEKEKSQSLNFSSISPQESTGEQKEGEWMKVNTESMKLPEPSPIVHKPLWQKKRPDLSICQDPPTPEGPLVPVNWEEEEEWINSLTTSLDIKPVQPPLNSTQIKTKLEVEISEKVNVEDIDTKTEFENTEIIAPDNKDELYSPSSVVDSEKSEDGSSDSTDSSIDSSSSSESSESGTESSREERGKIKDSIGESKKLLSPCPVPPPKSDKLLTGKTDSDSANEVIENLNIDMLFKVRASDITDSRDFREIQPHHIPCKQVIYKEVLSTFPNDSLIEDDTSKSKEVFRNTFVEITPHGSRSPDRKTIVLKDSDKAKRRVSEERASTSSYRSNNYIQSISKNSEKFKIDGKENKKDRSSSPRGERQRFNSPMDKRFSEKRVRSPASWYKGHSRTRSRSWSRSRSRTPDRRDRQKRVAYRDERRDRFSRSPGRSQCFNRERRSRESDWSLEASTDKTYDPLELLRGGKKYREGESSRKLASELVLREGSESHEFYEGRLPSELNFGDRSYPRDSLERDIMEGPIPIESEFRSRYRRETSGDRKTRDVDWDRREFSERSDYRRRSSERRSRSRVSPRVRHPVRRSERERFVSRSRSRSWSRSRSRSRTKSRSRSPSRSRSRSSSRSRSRSRLRSLDRNRRKSRSRSFSPRRGKRRRDDNRFRSSSRDRVRQIETIIHPSGMNPLSSEEISNVILNEPIQSTSCRYQSENSEDYPFYARNNLTYPPRMEDTSGSPRRLSLDDRLELELGIKKQELNVTNHHSSFAPHMIPGFSSAPIPMRVPGPGFHRPSTVVQVGNVLQVVPRDFHPTGVPPVPGIRSDLPPRPVQSSVNGSRVLRVGNVLQVVPTTTLDWSGSDPIPGSMEMQPIPQFPPPSSSALPICAVPSAITSSHPLPVALPPVTTTPVAPLLKLLPPKPPLVPQPVYNYEAIMETRKKEKEARRQLREEKRKEKERRRIIKMRKKAEKVIEKVNQAAETADHDVSEEAANPETSKIVVSNDEEEFTSMGTGEHEDAKEYGADDDEDEEVDLEGEADEDDEEDDEVEESEEEDEDSKIIPGLNDPKEAEESSLQVRVEMESSTLLPVSILPVPKKGILVPPGLWANRMMNGDGDENEDEIEDTMKTVQFGEDASEDSVETVEKKDDSEDRDKHLKTHSRIRMRKSVQFADGIKPGEGTSPSGCEGDMPSPPPPASISLNDPMRDLITKRAKVRKNLRKKPKRLKIPKAKKKVKVKIIKLKKPRITPLTALMMDDSDEMDDRSPPPPPPGSPPPPHLWPNYLAAYSATLKTVDAVVTSPNGGQPAPPPTPLPLLVPPPPLNYTIQPLNKA